MKFSQSQITVHDAQTAARAAVAAIQSGDKTLDFSAVTRVDSAAVAVLLEARRHCSPPNSLRVVSAPAALEGLIAVYGLQSLFSEIFA